MKLNKKTQYLLKEVEHTLLAYEGQCLEGKSVESIQKEKADYDKAEKELNQHLFKLEERLRKYKRAN